MFCFFKEIYEKCEVFKGGGVLVHIIRSLTPYTFDPLHLEQSFPGKVMCVFVWVGGGRGCVCVSLYFTTSYMCATKTNFLKQGVYILHDLNGRWLLI